MKFILILFYLISISSCLKLNLIDDYFVEVYIGENRKKYKLLVDLTLSYSYILKSYESKTKKTPSFNQRIFSNLYGNYSGKWIIDTFYFKEENLTIEMKFLDVYNKKKSLLEADGVLGLGLYDYSVYGDSIFYYLKNCSNNITIYDKINKKISLCESDESTKNNKIPVPLRYNDIEINYQEIINITKIIINEEKKDLKKYTFIGLIPLLITSKEVEDIILKEAKKLNPNITQKNLAQNNRSVTYKIFIEGKEFDYENDENINSHMKNILDLEDFENNFHENYKNYWYLGLNKNNVERLVIDYNKRNLNIYIKCKIYLIIRIILFILTAGFFIYAVFDVLTKKKGKNIKNENEQELMDM